MLQAMATAELGDDVFGEDPTVNALEAMAARRLGKQAALLVASGTMGNLVSLLAHCGRGDEIILGSLSHTFFFEQGGSAALGGIHPRTILNQPDGTLDLKEIAAAVRGENIHYPRTKLIVLENTHNLCCGSPIDLDYMQAVGDIARQHTLKIHVDGARIFNAAVALGVPPDNLAEQADSISFCLSKGLGAPVGSLVCGSREFIAQARRARKVVGGGMRQAGVLASAGIVALTQMVDRLADDHANARKLAERLAEIPGVTIDLALIKTNIVFFEFTHEKVTPEQLVQKLEDAGVRMLPVGGKRIRAVTRYHITEGDIDYSLKVIEKVIG
jgi:threonine aldolase